MKNLIYFLVLLTFSCEERREISVQNLAPEKEKVEFKNEQYYKFKPAKTSKPSIEGFDIDYSFKLGENNILVGYYKPVDGEIVSPDNEKDWGDRLMLLNNKGEIEFKSKGVGDPYLYEPYFYKNDSNDKTIIICQLAYEYFFGGDAYLLENGKISFIGNIDVEGIDMEKMLVDILKIHENKSQIVFTFDSDSLTIQPGSEDIIVKNNNIRYVYEKGVLKLRK